MNQQDQKRALSAPQAPNIMGGERFQIIRKSYSASAIKGQPPVQTSISVGPFKSF